MRAILFDDRPRVWVDISQLARYTQQINVRAVQTIAAGALRDATLGPLQGATLVNAYSCSLQRMTRERCGKAQWEIRTTLRELAAGRPDLTDGFPGLIARVLYGNAREAEPSPALFQVAINDLGDQAIPIEYIEAIRAWLEVSSSPEKEELLALLSGINTIPRAEAPFSPKDLRKFVQEEKREEVRALIEWMNHCGYPSILFMPDIIDALAVAFQREDGKMQSDLLQIQINCSWVLGSLLCMLAKSHFCAPELFQKVVSAIYWDPASEGISFQHFRTASDFLRASLNPQKGHLLQKLAQLANRTVDGNALWANEREDNRIYAKAMNFLTPLAFQLAQDHVAGTVSEMPEGYVSQWPDLVALFLEKLNSEFEWQEPPQ